MTWAATFPTRRRLMAGGASLLATLAAPPLVRGADRPRILQILYRGPTDVERGFSDYLASRGIRADVETRDTARDLSRVPAILEEARASAPDLVYTWGTPVTLATFGRVGEAGGAGAPGGAPGLFVLVSAPVASGVVRSLEDPGRDLTGVFHLVPIPSQLRLMRSYRPYRRLGVLYTPTERNAVDQARQVESLQGALDFRAITRPVPLDAAGRPDRAGIGPAVEGLAADGAECLLVPADTFLSSAAEDLRRAAVRTRLPPFAFTEFAMRRGIGVAGIVARYYAIGQLAASKAAEILTGTPARGVPVSTLSRFSLMVNVRFAGELDLYPPLAMLDAAELIDA